MARFWHGRFLKSNFSHIIFQLSFLVVMELCTCNTCSLHTWSEWSDCSSLACQGGVRRRTRSLYNAPSNCSGLSCWECGSCGMEIYKCLEQQVCFRDHNGEVDLSGLPEVCSADQFEGYWIYRRPGWYLFVNRSYNWTQAYHYCHVKNNMTLLTPVDKNENIFATGVLHQLVHQDSSFWLGAARYGYWSGGNDFLDENQFMQDDFITPISYSNFQHGEPNEPAFGNEDCVEIETGDGLWNDFNCFARLPFICYRQCLCYSGGACDRHTGRCTCRLQGDQQLGEYVCKPYVTRFNTIYGPLAGGTRVDIEGGYFDVSAVKIGNQHCSVLESNDTRISIVTPASNTTGSGNLTIILSDGRELTALNFTYLANPEIQSVHPLETFIQGGILLTIKGNNLNSVKSPWMVIHMTYKNDITLFPALCSVVSSTVLYCPTPKIELPAALRPRVRRRIKIKHHYNDEDLNFSIGFVLDGHEKYRSLSDTLPEYSVISVFDDPEIFVFDEHENVKYFQPHRRPFIDIMGRMLDHDWKDQVQVLIGFNGSCDVTSITWNQITCRPPDVSPSLGSDNFGPRRTPPVIVHVGQIVTHVGYLEWSSPVMWWSSQTFIIVASSVCILLVLVAIASSTIWRRRRRENTEHVVPPVIDRELAERNNYEKLSGRRNIEEFLACLDETLMDQVTQCTLHPSRLALGPVIGRGHFGKVLQGVLTDPENNHPKKVAVKSMKGDGNFGEDDFKAFLEEATLTSHLEHTNVLSVHGIVIKDDTPYAVLPYMENGDLKNFIANPYNIFSVRELLGFGLQVARGMAYLASHKYIHRDLAARNCMVDKDMVVKVADFGLSRDIYEKEYYSVSDEKRPLPIKWMPLESLKSGLFTTKSDVWSYGVVLWELITRGCAPYADVSNFQMKQYLMEGHRLSKPEYAPNKVFKLMTECWDEEPDKRPHFKNIVPRLMLIVNSQSQAKIKDVPIMKVEDYLQPLTMEHVQKAQSSDV